LGSGAALQLKAVPDRGGQEVRARGVLGNGN
jgi:hypothetical protein